MDLKERIKDKDNLKYDIFNFEDFLRDMKECIDQYGQTNVGQDFINFEHLENTIIPTSVFPNIISLNIKNTPDHIKWLDWCPNIISAKISKISDLSRNHKNLVKLTIKNNEKVENILSFNFPKLEKIVRQSLQTFCKDNILIVDKFNSIHN